MSMPPRSVCSRSVEPAARWRRSAAPALLSRLLPRVLGAAALLWPLAAVPALAADPAPAATTASKSPSASKGKGKGKSRAKKPKGTAATLSQMLQEKSSQVQDCAGQHALDKGANRVDIATKVTINNRGQVISINTSVHLDKGEGTPVKECIESLIRTIKFPPSEAPMITIERNWTIASG